MELRKPWNETEALNSVKETLKCNVIFHVLVNYPSSVPAAPLLRRQNTKEPRGRIKRKYRWWPHLDVSTPACWDIVDFEGAYVAHKITYD